jgi:hypothetical protein
LQNAQSYYQPPPLPPDGLDAASLILLLIFIGFIVAMIWLIYWEPDKPAKKDDKTLREEINGIFKDLRENSILYNRPEFVPSLIRAQDKVVEALDKRNLFQR